MKSFLLSLAMASLFLLGCEADRTDPEPDPDVTNESDAREVGREIGRESKELGREAKEMGEEVIEDTKQFGKGVKEGLNDPDPDNEVDPNNE